MKINLGAGDRVFYGYLSVDKCPPADIITDLSNIWPWSDSSIDEVIACDIIEHIADKIHFMNELWRVLKPGAQARIEVPSATHGAGAFQDPTHKSFWTMNDFQYYEFGSFATKRLSDAYGIKSRFRIVMLSEEKYHDVREDVWKIKAILECVK